MGNLIEVDNLTSGYGSAVVLDRVSLSLTSGGSMALLGRNGMGKTTLLSSLMGLTKVHGGDIRFFGKSIVALPSYQRARAGLGWVPQEREIFRSLTVEENLTAVALPGDWTLNRVYRSFPRLQERRSNMGNQLSGGEQQMLAMARALMLNPKVLLLDEPLEGLAPLIAQEMLQSIQTMVQATSMAVILVEQHAHQILPITQNALVLERGKVVYDGESVQLLKAPDVLEQWLAVTSH